MADKPLIILVTSGFGRYREYLLRQVADAARVWLFTSAAPTWEHPYIVGHTVVDPYDAAAMVAAARSLPAVDGVLCWDELKMLTSAALAGELGLPGGDPGMIERCRDKHLTRTALAAAGVPQPASRAVTSVDDALRAADAIGYPVVVKPRALGASLGVTGVRGPEDVLAAYELARGVTEDGVPYHEAGVLVEEWLDGPEISVDCVCVGGRVTPLFAARKISGFPPYFEEVGHWVDGADPLQNDPTLATVLRAAHEALGFTDGCTHTELRLMPDGPKIIEVNCRLGGDLIPYLGLLATGIDPGRAAVEVACGRQPAVTAERSRVAAVRFLYPDKDATVADVVVDTEALPASVLTVGVVAAPGQRLVLPPAGHVGCRYAYAVAAGATLVECVAALDVAAAAVTLLVRSS
jgi:biotin carboxylase